MKEIACYEDKDRIFTNLYGFEHDWNLEGARKAVAIGRRRRIIPQRWWPKGTLGLWKKPRLRGCADGAGRVFSTGMKWSFMPKPFPTANRHYLIVNADESEPGTCKDREILRYEPHRLLEGYSHLRVSRSMAHVAAYIYIRGEFYTGSFDHYATGD